MIRLLVTFEADGHTIAYEPPATTGDIYTLCVDILSRGWDDTQVMCALAEWVSVWCEVDSVELLEKHAAILPALAVDMMASAGFEAEHIGEIKALADISSGADGFDPKADPGACECPRCAGDASASEYCKFNDVTERAAVALNWAYLASHPQFWDLPYSVYQIARTMASSRIQGEAAGRQKRDVERKEKENAKGIRERHGHRW